MSRLLAPAVVLATVAAVAPVSLPAQTEVSGAVAWHPGAPRRTQYVGAWTPWRFGPLDLTGLATLLDGRDGNRYGAGLELGLLRHARTRLAVLGGVVAGLSRGGPDSPWGAWWVGAGYDVVRLGPVALAAEARYTRLSAPDRVVTLGARVRIRTSGRPGAGGAPGSAVPATAGVARSGDGEARVQSVLQTALDVMGTPYVWGGTDANGFDCSGLIQYAYAREGILLARRSADQAREGVEVGRDPFALLPGDILTFVIDGAAVSHVGLYLGEGRFIHSGTRGVQVSALRPTDPVGRYWWDRWHGARRIVP